MKEIYVNYVAYNRWANRRLVEVFSQLPDEQLEQFIENSFPSVRKTMLHIWDAESLWLSRLRGHSPDAFPSKHFVGDNHKVMELVLQCSQDFLDFVQAQDPQFFSSVVEFVTLSYGAGKQQAFEMIHHCMNHSTFHRGQLVTLGRQLGIREFPPTDFIFYLKEVAGG